jgi:serine/threonine protein kinase
MRDHAGEPSDHASKLRDHADEPRRHAKNIHGDVKPENVIVGKDGHVTVIDFGIATRHGTTRDPDGSPRRGAHRITHRIDTLPYMSPEQVRGEEIDRRSDLYSVGVLLYQMQLGGTAGSGGMGGMGAGSGCNGGKGGDEGNGGNGSGGQGGHSLGIAAMGATLVLDTATKKTIMHSVNGSGGLGGNADANANHGTDGIAASCWNWAPRWRWPHATEEAMSNTKVPAQHVSVRLEEPIIARIDAFIPRFSVLGRDATRSDVLREIILLGTARFEEDPEGAKRELMQIDRADSEPT